MDDAKGVKDLGSSIQLAILEERGRLIIKALSIVRRLAAITNVAEFSQQSDIEFIVKDAKELSEKLGKLE